CGMLWVISSRGGGYELHGIALLRDQGFWLSRYDGGNRRGSQFAAINIHSLDQALLEQYLLHREGRPLERYRQGRPFELRLWTGCSGRAHRAIRRREKNSARHPSNP